MLDLFGNEIEEEQPKKKKDWSGNARSLLTCNGARTFAIEERQSEDFYATEPKAVEELLERETFSETILEPCVGQGHIAKVLIDGGYKCIAYDIVDRGFPGTEIKDFLTLPENHNDLITNPPYKFCKEFVEHALDISPDGTKIAMFLKLTFLESQSRKELFEKYPFKTLYVFSSRRSCAKNGDFEKYPSSAVAYGWYVWVKGFKGNPEIKWI